MLFKFHGKTYGKIKNENDMLGFLIAHMDSNKDILSDVIREKSGLDDVSCYQMLKTLEKLHYIIYTNDTISVVSLGQNNYRSPMRRFLGFLGWRVWDLIIFLAGIFSGVAVTYLSHILIK